MALLRAKFSNQGKIKLQNRCNIAGLETALFFYHSALKLNLLLSFRTLYAEEKGLEVVRLYGLDAVRRKMMKLLSDSGVCPPRFFQVEN